MTNEALENMKTLTLVFEYILGRKTMTERQQQNEKEVVEPYRREIIRLKSSPSFRIGAHIVKSFEKPWRLLFIWFSLPVVLWNVARERWGKRTPEYSGEYIPSSNPQKNSIILFPTNGVGFGHFTRILAVARRIRKLEPDLEIIFFTTMPTLHILSEEGFSAYHVSGRSHFSNMDAKTWNTICEEMLRSIIVAHQPKAFIFDGSFPYRGMLDAIKNNDEITKVWMKRGMYKKRKNNIPIDSLNHFDVLMVPIEHKNTELPSANGVKVLGINPITLLEKADLLDRSVIRSRLGIPDGGILVYLQLGAGRINKIDSEINLTLDALLSFKEVNVVIGESMIGERIVCERDRVSILRDYPNSMYFNGFDFSIMAGGYNSFHEVIKFNLPTICYPNMNTGKDDQLGRAELAKEAGCMFVIEKRTKKNIQAAVNEIMSKETRDRMRKNSESIQYTDGAEEGAKHIIDLINK